MTRSLQVTRKSGNPEFSMWMNPDLERRKGTDQAYGEGGGVLDGRSSRSTRRLRVLVKHLKESDRL